jgi:hypothetical protein
MNPVFDFGMGIDREAAIPGRTELGRRLKNFLAVDGLHLVELGRCGELKGGCVLHCNQNMACRTGAYNILPYVTQHPAGQVAYFWWDKPRALAIP